MKNILIALCLCLCMFAIGQDNLWPDSGFDTSTTTGGRTGNCLRLFAEKRVHWAASGERRIKVTPFAMYELSVWVKGKATDGGVNVLYTYSYNCYGWFTCGQPYPNVKEAADWTKYTRRVIAINDTMTICPLSILDCGAGEFFADDMSVVQVKTPEESIAYLEGLQTKDTTMRQVLMRWYLEHGNVEKAAAVIDQKNNREVAEFHCLMAQRSTTEVQKLEHVSNMLAAGCYEFPDAGLRMKELLKGVPMETAMVACFKGLEAYKGKNPKQLDCLNAVAGLEKPVGIRDAQEKLARLSAMRNKVDAFVQTKMSNANGDWVKTWQARYAKAQADILAWLMDFGYCRVSLAGHPLDACIIVLPNEATPSEAKAAAELQLYLSKQTSVEVPIVTWQTMDRRYPMFIGRVPESFKKGSPVDYAYLRTEGIHVELTSDGLLLCGGQRGVLYAVYTFLEEQLGWRWFTDDCVTGPKDGTFELKPFKQVYVPPFDYRRTSYIQFNSKPWLITPLKLSAMDMDFPEWGGNYMYKGWVHTFQALVPRSKYAAEHPEYYSMIRGKRVTAERTQLCLTNPQVKAIAIETVRDWLRNSKKLPFAVSISQNDWHNYCECPECKALAEKEGSQSGPLLHFVNAIADEIGKEYPEVWIDTLAYQYTRKAPKFVRPRKNVIVRLCSIECCFVHGLDECEANKSFVKDIEEWSKIAPFLSIWDYTINFAHSIQPFPNLRVLQKNARFYRKWGVRGLFEQGNRYTKGGELMDLRAYLIAKLLWNPDYDVNRGIREFTDAYYGAAAPYIRTYIDFMHDWICGTEENPTKIKVWIYAPPERYLNDFAKLAVADRMLEQAEAAVKGQEPYATRAAVAHMPLWYTMLQLKAAVFQRDANGNFVNSGDTAQSVAERFEAAATAVGMTQLREGGTFARYRSWLESKKREATGKVYKPETLKNQHGSVVVIPSLGGRVWSCTAADGREMMKIFRNSQGGYNPFDGGYEEYSSAEYQSAGFRETYDVVEKSDTHIVVQAKLGDKTIRRRIELLPDRAGYTVISELTGKGAQLLRVHPQFACESVATTSLWFWHNGAWEEQSLAGRDSINLYYQDKECPQGKWGFADSRTGQGILNTFDVTGVDFCYVNAKPEENRLNLEQWSKSADGKVILKNTYEFWKR